VGGFSSELSFIGRLSSLWVLGHSVEMTLQCIDMMRPKAAKRDQPSVNLLQRLGPKAVKTPLRIDARLDETCLSKHPKVF